MLLTLKELAQYLRVNERTVLRMLKSGQIEGTKIGGQWRFSSSQIDQMFFSEKKEDSEEGEEGVSLSELADQHAVARPVNRVLRTDRIIPNMEAEDKDQALQELLEPLFRDEVVLERKELLDRIRQREELLSTGVGGKVAIPHPRDPVADLQESAVIVMGRSAEGIDFDAVDGEPVHLFFLLCCEQIETHLYFMGQIAQLVQEPGFVEDCIEKDTPEDLFRFVMETEQKQQFRTKE